MRQRARKVDASGDPAWVLERPEGPAPLRRRRGDRRPLPEGVRVSEPELDVVFDAFDLSCDGVFLHSELLMSIGDPVRLDISRASGPVVTVDGEVVDVWVEAEAGRCNAGAGVHVAFREISIADRETLQALAAR